MFKAVFVVNVYVGIKGRWACPICNVCDFFLFTYIFVSYSFYILLFVFTYLFFPLEHAEDVPLEPIGGYLLLTEVKFTTSGTIRYNVIKTSY
jgi:hypothetical protein